MSVKAHRRRKRSLVLKFKFGSVVKRFASGERCLYLKKSGSLKKQYTPLMKSLAI